MSENASEILDKILRLRDKFKSKDDVALLDEWETRIKQSQIRMTLLQIAELRLLMSYLMLEREMSKKRLSSDKSLTQTERDLIFAKIEIYGEVIGWFTSPESIIESIKEIIDKK